MAKRGRSVSPAARPVVAAAATPTWIWGAALVLAVVVAYAPALGAGWIWDDDAYVTNNAALRSLDGLWRIWFAPGATPQYYPLTFTSFWIEYHLWGLWPAGYHAVNVLLHAGNALLLWRILSRLGAPGALAAAALFALHPVQVESVAWVTERKNVLSGAFYLAAMLVYLRQREHLRTRDLLASLALFAGALLSKTIACSLPAALLLIVWWKRGTLSRRDVLPLLPMFALGGALAWVTIWMERSHVGAVGADWHLSFVDRCLIASRALWFYLAKLAWPAGLTFIYPRWQIDAGDALQFLPLVAALAALGAAFLARPRIGRAPLVALLFFAGTLLPALGFFDVFPMRYSFVADHYQYLACIGPLALAAGAVATWASQRGRVRVGEAAAVGVAGILAVLTWRQTHVYEGAAVLWTDTLAKNPAAWMAHNNLGLLRQNAGDLESARQHFEAAVRIKPDDDFAMNNLGNVLGGLGRPLDAASSYRAAIAANARNSEARNNLGNVLAGQSDLDGAAAQYREAVRLSPRYAEAHSNLGNILAMQGSAQEALGEYEAALRFDPDYADAHFNLAALLAGNGHNRLAIEHLQIVVRLRPEWVEARKRLAELEQR